jgi:hypothetical protein
MMRGKAYIVSNLSDAQSAEAGKRRKMNFCKVFFIIPPSAHEKPNDLSAFPTYSRTIHYLSAKSVDLEKRKGFV